MPKMNDLASDYERKQQAIVSSVFDPNTKKTTFTYRTVVDFNKKKLYTIPANDTSKCYESLDGKSIVFYYYYYYYDYYDNDYD
nr:hypothetical protein BaRGS_024332 [Batillaria attramentaria]